MEISQFTYFQQVGNIPCKPVSTEITYGLERIAMIIQNKNNIFDIEWNENQTYGDIFADHEKQFSQYNFDNIDVGVARRQFKEAETECENLLKQNLSLPAYHMCLKASHLFNMLDSCGAISVMDRTRFISNIRKLARLCFENAIENKIIT